VNENQETRAERCEAMSEPDAEQPVASSEDLCVPAPSCQDDRSPSKPPFVRRVLLLVAGQQAAPIPGAAQLALQLPQARVSPSSHASVSMHRTPSPQTDGDPAPVQFALQAPHAV
jgi:hypothetical protein